jgi:uncharacterized protein (TIGR01589 family)
MTQTEIIAALQTQANIDPAFTCLVWQKLEEQNPEFFYSYGVRINVRDQIVAFNYLVDQQVVSADCLFAVLVHFDCPSTPHCKCSHYTSLCSAIAHQTHVHCVMMFKRF